MRQLGQIVVVGATALIVSALGLAGCSKARSEVPPATSSAPPAARAAAPKAPTPMPKAPSKPVGNVTSTPSEHIATATAEAPGKGGGGGQYHGKPQMQLDSKTLADVRSTIEQTCQLLEEGVDLLEKHAKRPERAAKAINKYRKKNAARIDGVFKAAADVRARLRSVGYDQDIPAEVRPEFEKRMGAIQERLEKMRETYRKHRDVLEAFGQLFPRAQ